MVLNFGGTVEVQRAGTDEWVSLKMGDPLRAGDKIRTSADGHLEFAFDVARMKVQESSEVTLKMLDLKMIRAEVTGHAEAEVPEGHGSIALEGRGGNAVASIKGGRFSLYSDGKGTTSVGSLDGIASLASGSRTVSLKSGEFSAAKGGASPSRPAKIPKRVTLRVSWPTETEVNKSIFSLRGKASVLARVIIHGGTVKSDADGSFVAEVTLRRGTHRVSVAAVDPLGRRAADSREMTFDPDAPDIKGQVEYR